MKIVSHKPKNDTNKNFVNCLLYCVDESLKVHILFQVNPLITANKNEHVIHKNNGNRTISTKIYKNITSTTVEVIHTIRNFITLAFLPMRCAKNIYLVLLKCLIRMTSFL
jgi:hypothetical protein